MLQAESKNNKHLLLDLQIEDLIELGLSIVSIARSSRFTIMKIKWNILLEQCYRLRKKWITSIPGPSNWRSHRAGIINDIIARNFLLSLHILRVKWNTVYSNNVIGSERIPRHCIWRSHRAGIINDIISEPIT